MKNSRFIKYPVITFLALQLYSTMPLSANYSLDDIDSEQYQVHYNKLPSVENSDQLLKSRASQFSHVLQEAEKIVLKHEMEGYAGLRLIHSHFSVGKNQVMLEHPEKFEGVSSLITYAQDIDVAKEKKALPASWIFKGARPEERFVYETSTDPSVHAGVKLLQERPTFVEEIKDLLLATQFNSLLSLALLKRESLVAKEDDVFMELNSGELKKSIVQPWNVQTNPIDYFRTSWSFKGPKQQGCIKVSTCVKVLGKHAEIYIHKNI